MQKTITQRGEIKLVGITARTNNAAEMNPEGGQIPKTLQKYFGGGVAETIPQRKHPGTTFCVYTDYTDGVSGDYTYFVGEEVSGFETVPDGLQTLVIPPQAYAQFTNEPGPMPVVCIALWQHIWALSPSALGGDRTYLADFEVYDARSYDSQNTVLDIYIGIKG